MLARLKTHWIIDQRLPANPQREASFRGLGLELVEYHHPDDSLTAEDQEIRESSTMLAKELQELVDDGLYMIFRGGPGLKLDGPPVGVLACRWL